MAIEVITEFSDKATPRTIAYVKDDDGALTDPTAVTITIYDKDGVQKAGYIGVSNSTSFTAGLVVTGATSGAKGVVISKPDGTTLELQQVTGVWQSGEGITDTGEGTSTTTSVLIGAAMTSGVKGIYEYYYHKGAGVDPMEKGNWRGLVLVADGTLVDTIYTPKPFSFKVK